MHLEMGGQRAQGLLDLLLRTGRVGGNGKAPETSWAACCWLGREAHQPQALRAVLNERDQAQCFGFARSSASVT
jgi:hypothetical protein